MYFYNNFVYSLMDFTSILLIAIGLSMDSLAVSISQGVCSKKLQVSQALLLAVIFGFFQGAMPLLGYSIGQLFADVIRSVDHWIAFVILLLIGIKMIIESIKKSKQKDNYGCEEECTEENFRLRYLTVLAVATSIDAMATGLIFTAYPAMILPAVLIIAATTFVFSLLGVKLGHKFGSRFKFNFEILGGIVLIFIGIKILLEHLTAI